MEQDPEVARKWQTDKNYRMQVAREWEQKHGRMTGQEFHLIVD